MQQTASVLMNAIQWRQGGCQKDIFCAMADTLVHRSFGSHNRGLVWTEWVAKILPDIVVISAGAHIKKDSDFDQVISEVVKDIQVLKDKNPKVTVVWKTQQPGGCFPQVTDEIWNASTWAKYPGKRYNWPLFYDRDVRVKQIMRQNAIPVIDLKMLYYRGDAHRGRHDCLHMCIPGPLDIFAVLFQNFLETSNP